MRVGYFLNYPSFLILFLVHVILWLEIGDIMLYKIVNGSVRFGEKTILESIYFEVGDQDKIALVGRNGCGKSTLLKCLTGEIELEEGIGDDKLEFFQIGHPKIGYIGQDFLFSDDVTLIDLVMECYREIESTKKKIELLESKMESSYDEGLVNKYHELLEQYQYMGGYTYQKEYEGALRNFGFCKEDKNKKFCEFSLGERARISFMILLLSKPDLLLLDEPTNHLDISTVEWLEDYLKNYPKSFVVVSHDRMFLDRITSVVYEIEYGVLTRYKGNYSSFLKQKRENYEKQLKDYEYQQKEIKRLQKIVDRFRYKPTKASMARSKLKQIERMVKVECPSPYDTRVFHVHFVPRVDSYRDVIQLKNLKVGYDKVLREIHISIEKGDKIGIIGHNGSGKSTFLKTILGIIPPISGKVVLGQRVEIGYFEQNLSFVDSSRTIIEEVSCEFPHLSSLEIRSFLGAFQFRGDDVFHTISSLSGGEKVRLSLCKIMMKKPNVLILDEPTNHLDILGKEQLEKILEMYSGTILFVSHDRYFISKIAKSILDFDSDPVVYYRYGYEEYVSNKKKCHENDLVLLDKKNIKKEVISDFKEKSKIERRLRKIENEVEILENEIQELNTQLFDRDIYLDSVRSNEIIKEIESKRSLLLIKEKEWDEISSQLF